MIIIDEPLRRASKIIPFSQSKRKSNFGNQKNIVHSSIISKIITSPYQIYLWISEPSIENSLISHNQDTDEFFLDPKLRSLNPDRWHQNLDSLFMGIKR